MLHVKTRPLHSLEGAAAFTYGIERWLTMRMNDCHGLKETVLLMQGKVCTEGEAEILSLPQ